MKIERVLTFKGPPAKRAAALDELRTRFPQGQFVTRTPTAVWASIQSVDIASLSRERDWQVSDVAYLDHGSALIDYDHLRENLGL